MHPFLFKGKSEEILKEIGCWIQLWWAWGKAVLCRKRASGWGVDLIPQLSAPLPYKDSDLYQLPPSLLRRLYDSRPVSLEGLLKVLSKASVGRTRLWGGKGQGAGVLKIRLAWATPSWGGRWGCP
jgi:hypothetical protein